MSIILGALGGAGEQLANVGQAMFKDSLDADRENRTTALARETHAINSGVDLQRQQTLEAYKETLKNAPLDRLGQRAKALAGEEVPVESAPVAQLSGNIPLADGEMGPKGRGFTGAVADARRDVMALPDGPDKTAAMKQLDAQVGADQKAADSIIVGARRKRTGDEAVQAALDEARKNGDLPAVAAYERELGKPARDERRIDVAEKKGEQAAQAAEMKDRRDRELAEKRDATQRYIAELRDETANRRLEALIAKMGGGANGTKEALSFIDGARKELANDAAMLKSMYVADIKDLGPTQRAKVKAEYEPKFAALEAKRTQIEADFNALREKVGLPSASAPAPSPAPDKAPAALPLPKEKSALQAGKVYQTSRGPAKWNGTAFEAQ
jgi:hypothetical protein